MMSRLRDWMNAVTQVVSNVAPEGARRRVVRYVATKLLGPYLKNALHTDQSDFSSGSMHLTDLELSNEKINDLFEELGIPFKMMEGIIQIVNVKIPWLSLRDLNSYFLMKDVHLTLRPNPLDTDDGSTIIENMCNSMRSSRQMAEECMQEDNYGDQGEEEVYTHRNVLPDSNSCDMIAGTIDNILKKIIVELQNVTIRLEYLPSHGGERGVAIILKVDSIQYVNAAGKDENPKDDSEKTNILSSFSSHNITYRGVTIFTEEMTIRDQTYLQNKKFGENSVATDPFVSAIGASSVNETMFSMSNSNVGSDSRCYQSATEFYETEESLKLNYATEETNEKLQSEAIESDDDEFIDDILYTSEPIMIAHIPDEFTSCISIKVNDETEGPKVLMDLNIKSLAAFLSPRQIFLLNSCLIGFLGLDIMNATTPIDIQKPENIDMSSSINLGHSCGMSGGLNFGSGWSTDLHSHDAYAGSQMDNFSTASSYQLSQRRYDTKRYSTSHFTSASSVTTSMVSSMSKTPSKAVRNGQECDPNAEVSLYNIHLASAIIVVLENEILVEPSTGQFPLTKTSVNELMGLSEKFFATIDKFRGIGGCEEECDNLVQCLNENCTENNLRILLHGFHLEAEQQRNMNGSLFMATISTTNADCCEVMPEGLISPLIVFDKSTRVLDGAMKGCDLLVKIRQIEQIPRGRHKKRGRFSVSIGTNPFSSEFDVTVIDRLHFLFNNSFNLGPQKVGLNKTSVPTDDSMFQLDVESSMVNVNLRFPILDLRPIEEEIDRKPWWKQDVWPDFLKINFVNFRLKYLTNTQIVISANEINATYYDSDTDDVGAPIAKANMKDNSTDPHATDMIEYPSLTIDFPRLESLLAEANTIYGTTIDDAFVASLIGAREYTPFCKQKVYRESTLMHGNTEESEPATEIFSIPGTSNEMTKFAKDSMSTSQIQLVVNLPTVSVQLRSKHMFEILYNRINTDLLLWEPYKGPIDDSKKLHNTTASDLLRNVGMAESVYAHYEECKSKIDADSSPSMSPPGEEDIFYYGVEETKPKCIEIPDRDPYLDYINQTGLKLSIGNGLVTLYTPVRDSNNHVIPEQSGEIALRIESFYLFNVSGFHNKKNLSYMCLEADSAILYHCGMVPLYTSTPPLRLLNCILPDYLQATIYKMPDDLLHEPMVVDVDRKRLSLGIEVKANSTKKIKRIKLSAGIQDFTLRYISCSLEHSWFTQLKDMFDVKDYPVRGYEPSNVISEMSLNIWNCAIDYRPFNLTVRSIMTLENFVMTSNITLDSFGCTLRFIAEHCTVCLGPNRKTTEEQSRLMANKITVLPASDLICVVDLGLLEISIRKYENPGVLFPKFDLKALMNDIHIRTCADSARALIYFISYLSNYGDFVAAEIVDDEESRFSEDEAPLLDMNSRGSVTSKLSEAEEHHVRKLIRDAMDDTSTIYDMQSSNIYLDDEPIENERGDHCDEFYFPGEQRNMGDFNNQCSSPMAGRSPSCASRSPLLTNRQRRTSEVSITSMTSAGNADEDEAAVNEVNEMRWFERRMLWPAPSVEEALPQVVDELGGIQPAPRYYHDPIGVNKKNVINEDDFVVVDIDELSGNITSNQPSTSEPIRIIDNHFTVPPNQKEDLLKTPENFPCPTDRYVLGEFSFTFYMYGGNDFRSDPLEDSDSECEETKCDEKSMFVVEPSDVSIAYSSAVVYNKIRGANRINQGVGVPWKQRGGPGRRNDELMKIVVKKARMSHEVYPNDKTAAGRQVLSVADVEIIDGLKISKFNKFLYCPVKRTSPTQETVIIKAIHIRPNVKLREKECILGISMLPLRLNVDQDSLQFMINFFKRMSSDEYTEIKRSPVSSQDPIMMVNVTDNVTMEMQNRKIVNENFRMLMDAEEQEDIGAHNYDKDSIDTQNDPDGPIYFRKVIFKPAIKIQFDYCGKRIEFKQGTFAGLLMGLGHLKCSEITLRQIEHKDGILGYDKLILFLIRVWLEDIQRNQISKILVGVGPVKCLLQFYHGIHSLVSLPIETYKRDGQIFRGVQMGVQAFLQCSVLSALEITTRIIELLQFTAETAYDMLSPGLTQCQLQYRRGKKERRRRILPPLDIREGLSNGYQIIMEGIEDTAKTFVEVTSSERDQKGVAGAFGAVIRQIPPTAVAPIVYATKATNSILDGVKNQMVPDAKLEAREKWKEPKE